RATASAASAMPVCFQGANKRMIPTTMGKSQRHPTSQASLHQLHSVSRVVRGASVYLLSVGDLGSTSPVPRSAVALVRPVANQADTSVINRENSTHAPREAMTVAGSKAS